MTTAKKRWSKLDPSRSRVLDRARKSSDLTIPGLIPHEGQDDSTPLPTPYQSVGARGVNNISSKLLITLFPPDTAFFRLDIPEDVRADFGESTEAEVQSALGELERRALRRFEQKNHRAVMAQVLTHLVVAGNGLLRQEKEGSQFWRIDQYVVRRDPKGNPLVVIIKEAVSPLSLTPEVRTAVGITDEATEDLVKPVDVFTMIEWDYVEKRVTWSQEINDLPVPDSDSDVPMNNSPWQPLRWQAVPGEDYGRSLVMEYLGDLISLEELSQAIVTFAAVAAKIIFMVHPNATTDPKDLQDAISGDFVEGNLEDIDTLQLDKIADFQVAQAAAERIEIRLSHAFLLQAGTVRDAERVTAEEIRQLAQELENVLGGVYSTLAQELQLPFVHRLITLMKKDGEFPKFPKGSVNPVIITGLQALGRNAGVNRLRAFIADATSTLGPSAVQYIKVDDFLKRLAVGHGIEAPNDLLKSQDEVADEAQTAQTNEAITASAPGVAKEATKASLAKQT